MALAGFPVIRMAGLFQLPCVPCPVFLYSVVEAVGRPLRRNFPGLRKIKQIWPQPPDLQVRIVCTCLYLAPGAMAVGHRRWQAVAAAACSRGLLSGQAFAMLYAGYHLQAHALFFSSLADSASLRLHLC
jgi:hypothetical protein